MADLTKPKDIISRKLKNGWTVIIDRDACIGAATCIAVSEKAFVLDEQNKVKFVDTIDSELPENVLDGAKACPVSAIIVQDEQGKQIFPK